MATIFFDDFPGSSIDSSKWTVYNRLGDGVDVGNEQNAVTPANVVVSSSTMKITGKFEDVVAGDTTTSAPNPRTVHYTSGQIAQATTPFLYGTIDVRAKIAPNGTGLWPCIWMLGFEWQASQPFTANVVGHNWPHDGWWEVDIAEFMNGHRTLVNNALHFQTANRSGSGEKSIPFDATTRFMTYRLVWTATSMTWYVDAEDGVGFRTLTTMTGVAGTDIPNTAAYLVINMAVGGVGGGTPNSATFPQTMEVDYARITQGTPMTTLNLATVAVASSGLTTATTAYIDGDQVGAVMTFTLANQGIILSGQLVDKAKIIGAYDLFLFNASPTLASDNAPFTVSDADMLNCIGVIEFPYPKNLPSAMVNSLAHIDSIGLPTGASSTIYGALVTRSGHTFFGAATDLQVRLNYTKDV